MAEVRVLHYEVVRPLGRGGMGEVVEAVDTRLGRHVALKFVAPELAADPTHLRRFEREARAAAALSHPNIAVVHAFEVDGDRPFLAMELLPGPTLRALLSGGALPVPQALRIAREAASALAFAHGHGGIVHRDVKPENLMFDAHGAAKLMDFGLAHAASASRLTMTGSTLGTAAYMSPEAIAGKSEAASDVFALGVMLHEMLSGELPFAGESALAVMYAIANQPPRPLLEHRAEAGEGVAALVTRMLEKSPASRPTAERVRDELDALLGGFVPPEPGLVAGPGAETEELVVERRTPGALEPARPATARPLSPLLILLALLAVAAYPGWRWLATRAAARTAQAVAANDLGTQALLAHDLATAERHFGEALRLDAGYHRAAVGLAAVMAERGQRSEAATRLSALIASVPRGDHELRAFAWSHLAAIAIADGNWPDAVEKLRRAFAEDSSDASAYNQLGHALLMNGAADSARWVLQRGIARFPSVAPLHKNAGLAALAVEDLAGALAAADASLASDATYAPAWALRARARARSGDVAGARADFLAYRASSAADSVELADLTHDLAGRGVRLER